MSIYPPARLSRKIKNLLSKEKGTVYKPRGGRVTVCLVYPDIYYVGMSNLGFLGVYGLINERADALSERSFLPDEEDIEEYLRTDTPLFSYESMTPLREFDIVAFSVSFENDYPNIPKILKMAHIPLMSEERNDNHPLIVMGGITAWSNPEPLAPFMDVIVVSDAEVVIDKLIEIAKVKKRKEVLELLGKEEGFYVPSGYEVRYTPEGKIKERISFKGFSKIVKRLYLDDLNKGVKASIITPETEFSDIYLIEAMRSCPWRCRFCLVGHITKPVRTKSVDFLRKEIEDNTYTAERFGIIGPSLSEYRDLKELLRMDNVTLSITSLRAAKRSEELIGLLRNKKSVSIAPEAGTQRLRDMINKKVTEEEIIEISKIILTRGIENLRLYFIMGLPFERDDDILGIVKLTESIRRTAPVGIITLSISIFVPKPFTPFQWFPMESEDVIKKRLRILKKSIKGISSVRLTHELPKYAYMQGLFSLGDRRLSKLLACMSNPGDWRTQAIKSGIDPDFYIFRKKDPDEIFPWDFIDNGVNKDYLLEEYNKVLRMVKDG